MVVRLGRGWLAMNLMLVIFWGIVIFGGIAAWRAAGRSAVDVGNQDPSDSGQVVVCAVSVCSAVGRFRRAAQPARRSPSTRATSAARACTGARSSG